ncbi:MAG: ribosome biogenesis protein [Candidatus Nanohaloarchaeota archaeon]|nr:ribosome biogenesis protein [Candidatus Nanohaloarchaeota archaeon]
MKHIRKCKSCGIYTLKEFCPNCGKPTWEIRKYKFKYDDKYFEIKMKAKYGE